MIGKTTKVFSRRIDTMSDKERKEAELYLADGQRPHHLLNCAEFLYDKKTGRVVLCLI